MRIARALLPVAFLLAPEAETQRTQENTVREAEDDFGKSIGSETISIYSSGDVRGFSAVAAGNNRVEGIYFDRAGQVSSVIVRGSEIRFGLTAFGYPLPAAWFLVHRIREAMRSGDLAPFGTGGGAVEVDKTYFGQK